MYSFARSAIDLLGGPRWHCLLGDLRADPSLLCCLFTRLHWGIRRSLLPPSFGEARSLPECGGAAEPVPGLLDPGPHAHAVGSEETQHKSGGERMSAATLR